MSTDGRMVEKAVSKRIRPLLVKEKSSTAVAVPSITAVALQQPSVSTSLNTPVISSLKLPSSTDNAAATALHQPLIDTVMADQSARRNFGVYAAKTHVDENWNFINEIVNLEEEIKKNLKEFNSKLNSATEGDKKPKTLEGIEQEGWVQKRFQKIYFNYIVENSTKSVNIAGETRAILVKQNNNNSELTPQSTKFKLDTFKIVFMALCNDLSVSNGPMASFYRKFLEIRKARQQPQTETTTASTNAIAATTVISAAATTSTTQTNVGRALHYQYPHSSQSPYLSVRLSTTPLSGTISSIPEDSSRSVSRGNPSNNLGSARPTAETQRSGYSTPTKHSPLIAAVSATLPALAPLSTTAAVVTSNNSTPIDCKNAITSLHKQLTEYLATIEYYKKEKNETKVAKETNEDTFCKCLCFSISKKYKPTNNSLIYDNIDGLVSQLNQSLQNWSDDNRNNIIETVKGEIFRVSEQHKRLSGNKETQIIEPMTTAHGILDNYNPNRHTPNK